MLNRFKGLSKASKISVIVIFCHFALVCVLGLSMPKPITLQNKPNVLVKTVYLKKAEPVKVQKVSKEPEKPKAVEAKVEPKKKTVTAKKVDTKKKVAAKKKVEPKKKAPSKKKPVVSEKEQKDQKKRRELLASLKQSLENIDDHYDKQPQKSSTQKVQKQANLKIDRSASATTAKEENLYKDAMVNYLQEYLRLPEFGEVKIRLHIMMSGDVKRLEVTHSESKLNRKYIEKLVPSLSFPPFANRFEGAAEKSFVITLKNAF